MANRTLFRSIRTLLEVGSRFYWYTQILFGFIEWISYNKNDTSWNSQITDIIIYHEASLKTPLIFSEIQSYAQDSKVYHAMLLVSLFCLILQGLPTNFE